ncbi:Roundabout 3 [Clonorchis sinensis]|uniref:Roundabout 3 n=1 Tax=Clonorchis sinensis TaxID=79923 RepID=A0A3R7GRP4_CLOSI|nr:Roundabout 3 [Clonorchis sinensis]
MFVWFHVLNLILWMTNFQRSDTAQTVAPQESSKKPVIRQPPTETYSADGVLEFVCQADGVPKPVIHWYDASTGQTVIDRVPTSGSTSGIHVNQHYGRLMISNPTRDKVYTFYCNASNSAGWTVSHPPVKGGLAYLDSVFRQLPLDKTVHEGDRVLLECVPPKGVPKPYVLWLRDGKPFAMKGHLPQSVNITLPSLTSVQVTEQGELQLDSVRLTDSGSYVCVAGNIIGKTQSPAAKLTIQPRVRFIETPKDIRARQGMDVKFRCRTEGNHLVQWGKGQDGGGIIDHTRTELAEGYLLLKNVQPSDAGVYVCTAPGGIAADAQLTVETPPTFSRTPDDLTVHEGDVAVFHCITNGYPKPSIYWELPDKTPIFPSDHLTATNNNNRFYLHNDGRLEINRVKLSDAGKYQCTAHSSIDRIHSSAILQVIPDPHANAESHRSERPHKNLENSNAQAHFPFAPIIGLPPANQTRTVGDVVTLDCELSISRASVQTGLHVHKQPMGIQSSDWTVSWYRNTASTGHETELLDFSGFADAQRYSLLPGGSLQIVDVQPNDAGSYTCSAHTLVRLYSSKYDAPLMLQSNWTAYLNIVPLGTPIPPEYGQENPLSPPRNVHVTNHTDTTVTLAWDAANWIDPGVGSRDSGDRFDGHHIPITYWVEFYRADRPLEGWKTVEQNWQANTVKIGGLETNTLYYFLIRPRWSDGRVGWVSPPIGPVLTLSSAFAGKSGDQTTGQLHKGLTNKDLVSIMERVEIHSLKLYALTPRHLRVSWTVEEPPGILQLINGFTIYYREANILRCIAANLNLLNSAETADVAENESAYCSLQLKEGDSKSQLYLRLQDFQRLRTIAHQSPDSKYTPKTSSTMSLEVKADFVPNEKQLEQMHPVMLEGSGLLRDLEPFRCYEVSVKSHLTNGLLGKIEGRESVAHTVLTFESFPSLPPDRIAALWVSATEVELTWTAPPVSAWNGLLSGYASYVYDEFAHNYQTFNTTINSEMRIRIRGLTSPSAYFIQMAAVTCKGVGLRSKPLKLNPDLRQPGLGVGWGYDERTGLPAKTQSTKNQPANVKPFIQQPWFIIIVVISIVLWISLTTLIVCFCRRQRYTLRKTTGAVLIANNSHSTSLTGDNGVNTQGSIDERRTGRFMKGSNNVQLEPLISPASFKTDLEMFASLPVSTNQLHTTTDDMSNYGVYSVTQSEMDRNQWPSRMMDTPVNRNSVYPVPHSLVDGVGFVTYESNGTLVSRPQTMSPHVTQNFDYTSMNQPAFRPMLVPTSNNLANHPPNGMPQPPTYLTYQTQMVPLSQSTMEFPNPTALAERNQPYFQSTSGGGLPPIAPVAQLGSHLVVMERGTPSSVIESVGSFGSVAPYATASIIQNVLPPEPQSYLRNLDKRLDSDCDKTEVQNHSGTNSQSSMSEGSSYSTKRLPNMERLRDQRATISPVRICGPNMEHSVLESQNCVSTPAKHLNSDVPVGSHNTSSSQSKSVSTASTTTQQSEESNKNLRNRSPGSVTQGSGSSGPARNMAFTNPSGNSATDSIYSFADDNIPPPPASPPPPAPTKPINIPFRYKDFDQCQTSDRSSSCLSHFPDPRIASRLPETRKENRPAVYDMNAESSDDESDSTYSHRMSNKNLEHHRPYLFTVANGPVASNFGTSIHVPLAADEPQSSTYAQVY